MSVAAPCGSCLMGDHSRHDRDHGIREGLIGGSYCACTGDCAERFAADAAAFRAKYPMPDAPPDPPPVLRGAGAGGTTTQQRPTPSDDVGHEKHLTERSDSMDSITKERPESAYDREVRRARDQFKAATTDHQMTVLLDTLDDGTPYRHVRFAKPGTGIWSWSLLTWPGYLAINGDIGGFTFCRLHDMFDFFRGPGSINPGYWGEKVVAGARGTEHGENRYSSERFVESVNENVEWARDELTKGDFKRLKAAVAAELTDQPPEYIEEAHERLNDFSWNPSDLGSGYQGGFEFHDTWDWDLRGYDHHFLLACHAVQWGVNRYLAEHPGRFIPEGATR